MKESIILGLKGFIMGVANIIPGVSGGTLAITLGIYERLIGAASHFFKNLKENLKFLIPIGVGAVLALLVLSNMIGYSLEHYPVPTTLLFTGLILGGLPILFKKVKGQPKKITNIFFFLLTFGIILVFTFLQEGSHVVDFTKLDFLGYVILFIIGVIAAATMVIPGISGSFVLMMLGYYEPIINTIRDLSKLHNILDNCLVLIPFGIGILVGIVGIARLIEYLLKKYETATYYGILGFVTASIISILVQMGMPNDFMQVIIGIILAILGFGIAYKLGEE